MPHRYDDMEKLALCPACASVRYRFDGHEWRCWGCVPPANENVIIRVELDDKTQKDFSFGESPSQQLRTRL